jgi:hypothetical protein
MQSWRVGTLARKAERRSPRRWRGATIRRAGSQSRFIKESSNCQPLITTRWRIAPTDTSKPATLPVRLWSELFPVSIQPTAAFEAGTGRWGNAQRRGGRFEHKRSRWRRSRATLSVLSKVARCAHSSAGRIFPDPCCQGADLPGSVLTEPPGLEYGE